MSALYRKHRPQDFDEVVGQEHVVRTLRNAVEHDRVAHAYLFTGPRGTGKTSIASILAKALNCEHGADGDAVHGVRVVPLDPRRNVARRDRARRRLNRGIDDIRELRDRVALRAGARRAARSTSSTRSTCSRRRRRTRS